MICFFQKEDWENKNKGEEMTKKEDARKVISCFPRIVARYYEDYKKITDRYPRNEQGYALSERRRKKFKESRRSLHIEAWLSYASVAEIAAAAARMEGICPEYIDTMYLSTSFDLPDR